LGKLLDNCVASHCHGVGRSSLGGAAQDGPPVGPDGDPLLCPSPGSALAVPSLGPGGALYTGLSRLFSTLPSPAAQVSNDPPPVPAVLHYQNMANQ
jgi:hypothetical protein